MVFLLKLEPTNGVIICRREIDITVATTAQD